ncbi:MAG: rod shape-determining protein MreD [Ferruginibacter sp.]
MSSLVKNIIRFVFFIFFQVFVLDKIHLHQMVTPYLYFLFILWLPFNINRTMLLVIAFITGFTIDSFHHHPGFHAAACLLVAYFRPFLVNILIPKEASETNYDEPSVKSLGGIPAYLFYVAFLTFIFNAWLFLLEAWQFGNIWYFLAKTLLSTLVAIMLIIITELLFNRKQRFRTNTA